MGKYTGPIDGTEPWQRNKKKNQIAKQNQQNDRNIRELEKQVEAGRLIAMLLSWR